MSCYNISFLCSLSPQQITLLATLLGTLLSEGLDGDEQSALGNVLSQTGQTLQTISALNESQQSQEQSQLICNQIEQLNVQLNLLRQQFKK